jgi:hypothetical protein
MACREDLRLAGGAYPRSCPDCGFGPCKKGHPETPPAPDKKCVCLYELPVNDAIKHQCGICGVGPCQKLAPVTPVSPPADDRLTDGDLNHLIRIYSDPSPAPFRGEVVKCLKELQRFRADQSAKKEPGVS